MEKLYLLSADLYRQAYLQILLADIIIGRTLPEDTRNPTDLPIPKNPYSVKWVS